MNSLLQIKKNDNVLRKWNKALVPKQLGGQYFQTDKMRNICEYE